MEKISALQMQRFAVRPMTGIPAVLLEAFLGEQALSGEDSPHPDSVDFQRTVTLYTGARIRAVTCGEMEGHDCQAAALLVAIDELREFLDGSVTGGGAERLAEKLDHAEMEALSLVRDTMVRLLVWHFRNGAAGLLPIARWLGIVAEQVPA